MPCWTEAACADLIAVVEAANRWAPDPDDPVPGLEVSLRSIDPRLIERLEADLVPVDRQGDIKHRIAGQA